MLLAGIVLALVALVDHGCRACLTEEECGEVCKEVSTRNGCDGIACNQEYARCVCAGASALRRDGGCDEAPPPLEAPCEPTHSVLLVAAVGESPELRHEDIAADAASAPLQGILRHSVVAALQLEATAGVAISDMRFVTNVTGIAYDPSDPPTSDNLHFQWSFSLCTESNSANLAPELDKKGFEHRLRAATQHYQAFYPSEIRLLALDRLGQGGQTTRDPGASAPVDEEPTPEEVGSFWEDFWLVPWVAAAVIIVCLVAAWFLFYLRRMRKREKRRELADEFSNVSCSEWRQDTPSTANSRWRWHQDVLARALYDFDPKNSEHLAGVECLCLTAGDLLRIEAEADQHWLYGHRAQDPTKVGLIPRDRVQQLGMGQHARRLPEPPMRLQAELPVQGLVARAERPFVAGALECSYPGMLLSLMGGEDMEIFAADPSGWLYGCIAGRRGNAGFFPEDCIGSGHLVLEDAARRLGASDLRISAAPTPTAGGRQKMEEVPSGSEAMHPHRCGDTATQSGGAGGPSPPEAAEPSLSRQLSRKVSRVVTTALCVGTGPIAE